MEPGIGRAVKEGFRAANTSWVGIGAFAGGWLAVLLLVVLGVAVTNPPVDALQEQEAVEEGAAFPGVAEELQAVTPVEPAAELAPALDSEPDALSPVTDELAAPADEAEPAERFEERLAALPEPGPSPEQRASEAAQVIGEWFGRAWPLLTLCLLVVIAGSIWLSGAQIGYVAKRVLAQQATLAEFLSAGSRSFVPLLGGSMLWILAVGVLILSAVLIALALSALGNVLPGWLVGLAAAALVLAALTGLMWIGVRLSFWFIAIVADRLGPMAGLKASFRSVRGRWWKVAGLIMLMALISVGAWVVAGLIETIGNVIGGGAATVLALVSNAAGVVANLYISFATIAACVRFYEDAKGGAPTAS